MRPSKIHARSKDYNQFLKICDDFKTNLLWLSIFIPTVEGVGMRLPVNYRVVLQSSYFAKKHHGNTIYDAAFEENGDTFQNSPIKLLFYSTFHSNIQTEFHLSSVSKVNVKRKNLPGTYSYLCTILFSYLTKII